ncbi:MAG: VCBS repeat-containing protein [Planctomycetota bacterium]
MRILTSIGIIAIVLASITHSASAQLEVYRSLNAPPIIFPPGDYGRAVYGVGDLDQDGCDDYVVGTPTALLNQGQVRAYSGRTNASLWTASGGVFGSSFGFDVGRVGDLNNDGIPDVVVGDPLNDGGPGSNAGRVVVLSGADGSFIFQMFGTQADERMGFSVAGAGDVDNDGVDDIVAGAPFYDVFGETNNGRVRVISGATQSFLYSVASPNSFDQMGYDVAGNFDYDGNGFSDIAVGAPLANPNGFDSGEVRIYGLVPSSGGGLSISLVSLITGTSSGDHCGWSIATFEDITGDGVGDLAVSSPDEQNGLATMSGHIRLHPGPGSFPSLHMIGNAFDRLGFSIANAGDVNGDGVDDIVAGAIDASPNTVDEGEVRVFSGRDGTLIASRLGDPAGGDYGFSVAGSGDLDGDGLHEIIVGDLANQNVQVLNLPVAYPGSLEDLHLGSSIDGAALSLWPDRKLAFPGSLVTFNLFSPEGSYNGTIPATVGQLFSTLSPPMSPGGFPEIHVNPSQAFVIYDGSNAPPFAPALLPAQGLASAFVVPVGLSGSSLMIQGLSLSPSAQQMNNFFTATNGQEIIF